MSLVLLFAELADAIPLHVATRAWLNGSKSQASAAEMRWSVLVDTLGRYTVAWDPPVRRGPGCGANGRTMVTPITRDCVACGTPFFGTKTARSCGCIQRGSGAWRWPHG